MTAPLAQLESLLDYQFKNNELAQLALTHRSAAKSNNERLEFLGDALLDFIVGEALYHQHEEAPEGELSRQRAAMVNKAALAQIGRELRLGEFVRLGTGEAKSGGKKRDSILADTVEAVVAAVYLDGGIVACQQVVARITSGLQARLENDSESKDAKTRLQEYLQAQGRELPVYDVLATAGEAHAQTFHVACRINDLDIVTEGHGSSKRKAEQKAALTALRILENT